MDCDCSMDGIEVLLCWSICGCDRKLRLLPGMSLPTLIAAFLLRPLINVYLNCQQADRLDKHVAAIGNLLEQE